MGRSVNLTFAVTGSGDTAHKNPRISITPEQIANASIDARGSSWNTQTQ